MHLNIKRIDSNSKYYYILFLYDNQEQNARTLHVENKQHSVSNMHSLEDLTQPIYHRYRKKVLPKFLRKSSKIIFARRKCEKSPQIKSHRETTCMHANGVSAIKKRGLRQRVDDCVNKNYMYKM